MAKENLNPLDSVFLDLFLLTLSKLHLHTSLLLHALFKLCYLPPQAIRGLCVLFHSLGMFLLQLPAPPCQHLLAAIEKFRTPSSVKTSLIVSDRSLICISARHCFVLPVERFISVNLNIYSCFVIKGRTEIK